MDYNPNHRYRLQLQVPYYRIPKTRNRNRLAMKYQYFQYIAFSRYPLYTEIVYIKSTSKENAIKQIKKRLNKIGIGFKPFLLSEMGSKDYHWARRLQKAINGLNQDIQNNQ